MERIEQWVVVMFENRSFDSLVGNLPHIDEADGVRGREIELAYPGGSVSVSPTALPHDPLPDPGEGSGNVNVQLFGSYQPPSNLGRSAYPLFPDFIEAPFNAPADDRTPTMDGFALDFYGNFRWEKEREPTAHRLAGLRRPQPGRSRLRDQPRRPPPDGDVEVPRCRPRVTERGTVISDTFHTNSVLRTLRERFDLGPALTRRDENAPSLDVASTAPSPAPTGPRSRRSPSPTICRPRPR